VIAWRVILEPFAIPEIESGVPRASFPMMESRVSSPNAAKIEACLLTSALRLGRALDMALDIRHLLRPSPIIHPECFELTLFGNRVKSRFRQE